MDTQIRFWFGLVVFVLLLLPADIPLKSVMGCCLWLCSGFRLSDHAKACDHQREEEGAFM